MTDDGNWPQRFTTGELCECNFMQLFSDKGVNNDALTGSCAQKQFHGMCLVLEAELHFPSMATRTMQKVGEQKVKILTSSGKVGWVWAGWIKEKDNVTCSCRSF